MYGAFELYGFRWCGNLCDPLSLRIDTVEDAERARDVLEDRADLEAIGAGLVNGAGVTLEDEDALRDEFLTEIIEECGHAMAEIHERATERHWEGRIMEARGK